MMALTTWGGTLPLYVIFKAGGHPGAIEYLWMFHLLAFLGGLMVAVTGAPRQSEGLVEKISHLFEPMLIFMTPQLQRNMICSKKTTTLWRALKDSTWISRLFLWLQVAMPRPSYWTPYHRRAAVPSSGFTPSWTIWGKV